MNTKYYKYLKELLGYNVKVKLNGNDHVEGRLLEVNDEHLVLKGHKEDVLYCNLMHMAEISKNSKEMVKDKKVPKYIKKNSFKELLKELETEWVEIKHLDGKSVCGVISEVYDHHVIIIDREDIKYDPISQIVYIIVGKKVLKNNTKKHGDRKDSTTGDTDFEYDKKNQEIRDRIDNEISRKKRRKDSEDIRDSHRESKENKPHSGTNNLSNLFTLNQRKERKHEDNSSNHEIKPADTSCENSINSLKEHDQKDVENNLSDKSKNRYDEKKMLSEQQIIEAAQRSKKRKKRKSNSNLDQFYQKYI